MTAPDPEPVFAEPWQAQVFALVRCLIDADVISRHQWRSTLASSLAATPNEASPYLVWLDSLERLLAQNGLVGRDELGACAAAWHRAAERTPHGRPIELAAADRSGRTRT